LQVARMVQRIGRQPGQWICTGQSLAPGSLVLVMPSPADWQASSPGGEGHCWASVSKV
jgi:hypothetical protein